MKKYILTLLLALTGWCSAFAQTPLELNDKLADITNGLYENGKSWGAAFNEAYKSSEWSGLTPVRTKLQTYIKTNIQKVQTMKDVKNSKPMRMAMLEFLQYEQRMVTEAFMPFEKFSSSTSKEAISAAYENLQKLSESEAGMLEKVNATQMVYAKENGFQIEQPAEE